jgi:ABC-type phosphate/phosphonate transport system substrate-binding protein
MNALRGAVAPLAARAPFFGGILVTGSHRASVAAVAGGAADVAAVDCVVFALLADVAMEETTTLRVVGTTAAAPSPPYVTDAATSDEDVATLRRALDFALGSPSTARAREALRLAGVEVVDAALYDVILDVERSAAALGYPTLG